MRDPKQCKMRNMSEDDLSLVLSWRNLPEVRNNMYSTHEISMEEHLKWFANVKLDETKKYFIFEVNEEPVGVIAYTDINYRNKCASWAFYSGNPKVRGVGSLMELHAIEYAFNELEIGKLVCEVLSYNEAVIKFHRKHGFVVEGVFAKQHYFDGEMHDIWRLALFKNDWLRFLRPVFIDRQKSAISLNARYSENVNIDVEQIVKFSELSGDVNPIHLDSEKARQAGFRDRVVHGQYICSIFSRIIGTEFPGKGTILLSENIKFHAPVYPGGLVTFELKVISVIGRKAMLAAVVTDEAGICCCSGEFVVFI